MPSQYYFSRLQKGKWTKPAPIKEIGLEDYECWDFVLFEQKMYFTAQHFPKKYTPQVYNNPQKVYFFRLPDKYMPQPLRVGADKTLIDPETEKPLQLGDLNFAVGSSNLQAEAAIVLDQIVEFLEENADFRLEIAAHTDNTGTAQKNQKLSEQRAQSVSKYLTEKGISPTRLLPKGYGSTQAIADNASAEGRASNRRVSFKVLGKD